MAPDVSVNWGYQFSFRCLTLAIAASLKADFSSPAPLQELPDPQWIVLAAVFSLALAMQWQSVLKSNLLIASHHASNGSSSYPFLKMVSAEFFVFSNGYKNGFNHSHPQVESRASWLGMVSQATSKTGMQPHRFVENARKLFQLLSRCTGRYY